MSDLPELDPLIHAPVRLRIMSTLAVLGNDDDLSFSRLQSVLDLTAGNLITHLRKLEDAGYVESIKTRSDRKTATQVRLTPTGRQMLQDYTSTLRAWLDTTQANLTA